MFSKFFINRPIFATVVSIIIVLAGLVAMISLPIKEYPAVVPPQITVQAVYPGADAKTLATTVSATLEEAINGVENMTYMTSTASPSGVLSLSISFTVGSDVAQAKVDVNNRVQLALTKLPEEVRRQGISVKESSPDILKVFAFTSENQVHDTTFISNYLTVNVMDDLKRIKGVGDAMIFGEKNYSIKVFIDPDKLAFITLPRVILSALYALKITNMSLVPSVLNPSTKCNHLLIQLPQKVDLKALMNLMLLSSDLIQMVQVFASKISHK